ncbi:hypothetical protein [Paraburkholderia sp. SOS3]|uniref:hypothetical protein n=1 Tax=Paraburkholderia sp. SOS3 TaxID=1926494 RepID=UPI0012EC42FE|nr:hypothetical protein [Paraburkholderia sp. SOS3]
MRPSEALGAPRAEIRKIVADHHAANARIFGSDITGDDDENGDLDLLIGQRSGACAKRKSDLRLADYLDPMRQAIERIQRYTTRIGSPREAFYFPLFSSSSHRSSATISSSSISA